MTSRKVSKPTSTEPQKTAHAQPEPQYHAALLSSNRVRDFAERLNRLSSRKQSADQLQRAIADFRDNFNREVSRPLPPDPNPAAKNAVDCPDGEHSFYMRNGFLFCEKCSWRSATQAGRWGIHKDRIVNLDSVQRAKEAIETPEQMSVPRAVLEEINCTIWPSLQSAIDVWLAGQNEDLWGAALLIRPAVERLKAICEQNHFPE